jgi:hypothetical protein
MKNVMGEPVLCPEVCICDMPAQPARINAIAAVTPLVVRVIAMSSFVIRDQAGRRPRRPIANNGTDALIPVVPSMFGIATTNHVDAHQA